MKPLAADQELDKEVKLPAIPAHFHELVESRQALLAKFNSLVDRACTLGQFGNDWRRVKKSFNTVKFSAADYQASVKQRFHDSQQLELRASRLMMRISEELLRGAYYNAENRLTLSSDDPFNTLGDQLHHNCEAAANVELRATALKQSAAHLNTRLTENHKILFNSLMNQVDSELMRSLRIGFDHQPKLSSNQAQTLQEILERARTMRNDLREAQYTRPLFPAAEGSDGIAELLKINWDTYRALVKDFAYFYERNSWCSPTYHESGSGQCSTFQNPRAFETDYQRWTLEESAKVSRNAHSAFFRPTHYAERAATLILPSGHSALCSALDFVMDELNPKTRKGVARRPIVLAMDKIYFETDSAITERFMLPEFAFKRYDAGSFEQMLEQVRTDFPDLVIAAPIANEFEMSAFPIDSLFKILLDPAWQASAHRVYRNEAGYPKRKLTVVLDNTLSGNMAKWKNINFTTLPPWVEVISVESMLKTSQDGLDLTNAGMVTLIGEYLDSSFARFTRRHAAGISQTAARRLDLLTYGDLNIWKLNRHSTNARAFAQYLEPFCGEGRLIRRAINPFLPSHPNHEVAQRNSHGAPGLIHLELDVDQFGWKPFDRFSDFYQARLYNSESQYYEIESKNAANAMGRLILRLAQDVGLELGQGTSYGFNVSRFAIYTHILKTPQRDSNQLYLPYIRIAVGTETKAEMALLAQVIGTAATLFERIQSKDAAMAAGDFQRQQKALI